MKYKVTINLPEATVKAEFIPATRDNHFNILNIDFKKPSIFSLPVPLNAFHKIFQVVCPHITDIIIAANKQEKKVEPTTPVPSTVESMSGEETNKLIWGTNEERAHIISKFKDDPAVKFHQLFNRQEKYSLKEIMNVAGLRDTDTTPDAFYCYISNYAFLPSVMKKIAFFVDRELKDIWNEQEATNIYEQKAGGPRNDDDTYKK
jgi:hypothetical protein